jgi:hypothetical protein
VPRYLAGEQGQAASSAVQLDCPPVGSEPLFWFVQPEVAVTCQPPQNARHDGGAIGQLVVFKHGLQQVEGGPRLAGAELSVGSHQQRPVRMIGKVFFHHQRPPLRPKTKLTCRGRW